MWIDAERKKRELGLNSMTRRRDPIKSEPDPHHPGDGPIPIEAWLIVVFVLGTFVAGAFAFAKLIG